MELGLHLKMQSELSDVFAKLLLIIFEMSWRQGNVSDTYRRTNIALIFKTYQKNDPKKPRLVSLASVSGKIMEEALLEHISGYMKEKGMSGKS